MTHIRETQRQWIEDHKIDENAGWVRRLLHRVYVFLMLPSDSVGPG